MRKEINTGGPAFPAQFFDHRATGMTLRDYFATAVLQGLLADPHIDGGSEDFAELAYKLADAMLVAREKGGAA